MSEATDVVRAARALLPQPPAVGIRDVSKSFGHSSAAVVALVASGMR